jgi:hypothetical protein
MSCIWNIKLVGTKPHANQRRLGQRWLGIGRAAVIAGWSDSAVNGFLPRALKQKPRRSIAGGPLMRVSGFSVLGGSGRNALQRLPRRLL